MNGEPFLGNPFTGVRLSFFLKATVFASLAVCHATIAVNRKAKIPQSKKGKGERDDTDEECKRGDRMIVMPQNGVPHR